MHFHILVTPQRMSSVLIVLLTVLFMSGCRSPTDSMPKPGEYGEVIFHQANLSNDELTQMLAKSQSIQTDQVTNNPSFALHYTARSEQNPYRAVIIVRGTAMVEGDVKVKFDVNTFNAYANQSNQSLMDMEAGVDHLERIEKMKAGEAFVFVMAGDPFSLNAANDPSHMTSQLDLVNSSNVQFQNVELQIWQGKGSKYSLKRYVWFALIIFLIVWIYRVIVQRNADKFEDLMNKRSGRK